MNELTQNWDQLAADVVACVLLWSGAVKLWRPLPAAMAAVDFGVARRVSRGLGFALGLLEVSLAVWVFSEANVRLALMVAVALLLLFSTLILRALSQGKSFACACFGDEHDSISPKTFLRTFSLLVAAGAAMLFFPRHPDVGEVTQADFGLWSVAAAAVGTAALSSQVRGLLTWNRDPYSIGTVTWTT